MVKGIEDGRRGSTRVGTGSIATTLRSSRWLWLPVIGCLLLPRLALASPFTDFFDALRAELEARSAALSGSTDPADIKIKKAVDKVLLSLDKDSASLAQDLKTLVKVAKALEKTYVEEIGAQGPLFGILSDVLGLFESELSGSLEALQADIAARDDGGALFAKAKASAEAALALLGTASDAGTFSAWGKELGKVLKWIFKADKAYQKAISSQGAASFFAIVDGQAFVAEEAYAEFSTGCLNVGGARAFEGNTRWLAFSSCGFGEGISGPGTYPLLESGGFYFVCPGINLDSGCSPGEALENWSFPSGSLTVETFDSKAKIIGGTFFFSDGPFPVTDGRFLLKYR